MGSLANNDSNADALVVKRQRGDPSCVESLCASTSDAEERKNARRHNDFGHRNNRTLLIAYAKQRNFSISIIS